MCLVAEFAEMQSRGLEAVCSVAGLEEMPYRDLQAAEADGDAVRA